MAKQERPGRWDYTVLLEGLEPKLIHNGRTMKLDKLVAVADKERQRMYYYFIEADRATAALQTGLPRKRSIRDKAERFYRYAQDVGFRKHFGIPGARLLFLVPEEKDARVESIRRTVETSRSIPNDTNLFHYLTVFPQQLDAPEMILEGLCDVKRE